jgi:hypothetical protein
LDKASSSFVSSVQVVFYDSILSILAVHVRRSISPFRIRRRKGGAIADEFGW